MCHQVASPGELKKTPPRVIIKNPTYAIMLNMKFNKATLKVIRDKTQALLDANSILVMTPNRLLADLGLGPREMEELRGAVLDENEVAVCVWRNLERYRAYWEAEVESVLILQYQHPLLAKCPRNYDFNQLRYLLWQSRQKGVLNHFVDVKALKAMLPSRPIAVAAVECKNESGLDNELI